LAYGPSPGFRDLSWLRPVFVGDTISYETIVVDKRPSSRAGWGVVMSQVTGHSGAGHDQEGVKVFESFGASMQPLRGQN
jgi:acyl dehydratase